MFLGVHVVGHETVAQQKLIMVLHVFPEQIEIDKSLGVRGQDDLAGVAALGHMVRNINDNNTNQKPLFRLLFQASRRLPPCPASPFTGV